MGTYSDLGHSSGAKSWWTFSSVLRSRVLIGGQTFPKGACPTTLGTAGFTQGRRFPLDSSMRLSQLTVTLSLTVVAGCSIGTLRSSRCRVAPARTYTYGRTWSHLGCTNHDRCRYAGIGTPNEFTEGRRLRCIRDSVSETETPPHRLETVYRRLVERLSTADGPMGALRSVIDGWFFTSKKM